MKRTFTKIIATLGPATSSKERILELAKAGTNVFRLNFSHGTLESHKKNYDAIRQIEKELDTPLGVIADMQGPKLRIGQFKDGSIELKEGQPFRLDMVDELGDETRVQLPHQEIFDAIEEGTYLLLNDGNIRLRVTDVGARYANTLVITGGILSDHKGVNIPGITLPISALTEKDLVNLEYALEMGVDWIALSFVQRPEDIIMAKEKINERAWIITKIEKPTALKNLEEIIKLSDAIMVARGDLGVESPLESLPSLQKDIVSSCRRQGKPVIIATQMLESMIHNPTPTRAEVSDVATAVYDGVDCVMLSGETAVGEYPVLTVSMMRKIIAQTEEDPLYKKQMEILTLPPDHLIASAITSSIPNMVRVLDKPACVVTYSISGSTTLRVARERTGIPILCLTTDEKVMHRCVLIWGVIPMITQTVDSILDISPIALEYGKAKEIIRSGDQVMITAGVPFARKGATNIIHILTVE